MLTVSKVHTNMQAGDARVRGVDVKVLLEQHIGLRAYYPAMEDFYESLYDRDIGNARCPWMPLKV